MLAGLEADALRLHCAADFGVRKAARDAPDDVVARQEHSAGDEFASAVQLLRAARCIPTTSSARGATAEGAGDFRACADAIATALGFGDCHRERRKRREIGMEIGAK